MPGRHSGVRRGCACSVTSKHRITARYGFRQEKWQSQIQQQAAEVYSDLIDTSDSCPAFIYSSRDSSHQIDNLVTAQISDLFIAFSKHEKTHKAINGTTFLSRQAHEPG
jgi:hypothetical protein